jgi:hypothetical protein
MIKILDKTYPNLDLKEFVPKSMWDLFGSQCIRLLDQRMFDVAQGLRDYFGKAILINNWHKKGGKFNNRGYRIPTTTIGAAYSQHKFGRAIDFNIAGFTSEEVYNTILDNEQFFMDLGITCMEDIKFTPGWVHVDCRITNLPNKILIVKP